MEYFGHVIDKNGLHPSSSKVQAIKQAPPLTNITELKSYLGLVNYYHKFPPNLSISLTPLNSQLPSTIDHVPSPGNLLLIFSQLTHQKMDRERSKVRRLIQSEDEISDIKIN